jgi:hypothetical protein
MKKLATTLSAALLALALASAQASAQVQISEIRLDNSGTDTDEYFELIGPAGLSLSGYSFIAIGDGTGGCGVIESVTNLGAFSIQGDGVLCLRNSGATPVLSGYDGSVALQFENSDAVTYLLVRDFTGTNGQDLDTNNDGVLDVTPWSAIVDQVAITEGIAANCTTDEYTYATPVLGPDGAFGPGHIFRCGGSWYIGPFGGAGMTGVLDTPGAANTQCATPAKTATWGQVKTLYR